MTIEEQKQRAKVLKDLGPLAAAWEQYRRLKTVGLPPLSAQVHGVELRVRL
jgi:hypothetical protein